MVFLQRRKKLRQVEVVQEGFLEEGTGSGMVSELSRLEPHGRVTKTSGMPSLGLPEATPTPSQEATTPRLETCHLSASRPGYREDEGVSVSLSHRRLLSGTPSHRSSW